MYKIVAKGLIASRVYREKGLDTLADFAECYLIEEEPKSIFKRILKRKKNAQEKENRD